MPQFVMEPALPATFDFDGSLTESDRQIADDKLSDLVVQLTVDQEDSLVIRNAIIVGDLVVSDRALRRKIEFRNCCFSGEVLLDRSVFERNVAFVDCVMAGFSAEEATAKRGLSIHQDSGLPECKHLNLASSVIVGRLRLEGLIAVSADLQNASIKGDVAASGMNVNGALSFENATVTRQLNLKLLTCNTLSLAHGSFSRVLLDGIRATSVAAQRVSISRSFYVGKRKHRHSQGWSMTSNPTALAEDANRPSSSEDRLPRITGTLRLSDAVIGGQVALTDCEIGDELVINGLRASTFEMDGGFAKAIRCRGGVFGVFIIRNVDSYGERTQLGEVILQKCEIGEVSILWSHLGSLDLSDTTISGSLYLRDPLFSNIRAITEMEPYQTSIGSVSGWNVLVFGAMILRDAIMTEVRFNGLRCQTLSLTNARGLKLVSLSNARIEAFMNIGLLRCERLILRLSNLAGGLNGEGALLSYLDVLSSEIHAQSVFAGASIESIAIKDSNLESLVLEKCAVARLWLDDVRASNVSIVSPERRLGLHEPAGFVRMRRSESSVKQAAPTEGRSNARLAADEGSRNSVNNCGHSSAPYVMQNVTIEASVLSKLDIAYASDRIKSLSVTSSTLESLEVVAVPAFKKATQAGKNPGQPHPVLEKIDLTGTTYRTVKCNVPHILGMWARGKQSSEAEDFEYPYASKKSLAELTAAKDDRVSIVTDAHERMKERRRTLKDGVRPSLAVLESALRAGGYDDWADKAYLQLRWLAWKEPISNSWFRNLCSFLLSGYGLLIAPPLVMLVLPALLATVAVFYFPLLTAAPHGAATIVCAYEAPKRSAAVARASISMTAAAARCSSTAAVATTQPPVGVARIRPSVDLVMHSYIPGAGDSNTLSFSGPGLLIGDLLRISGWFAISIFIVTLQGVLRYAPRGR